MRRSRDTIAKHASTTFHIMNYCVLSVHCRHSVIDNLINKQPHLYSCRYFDKHVKKEEKQHLKYIDIVLLNTGDKKRGSVEF